jgi:hypothetical protein
VSNKIVQQAKVLSTVLVGVAILILKINLQPFLHVEKNINPPIIHKSRAGTDSQKVNYTGISDELIDESELKELRNRYGVHGPQNKLIQLFTAEIDGIEPLREHTLDQISQLKPVILEESKLHHINPMLVTAILFDEIQHSKPGKDIPLAAHSKLFKDHGPAQLSIHELVLQGLLKPNANEIEINRALDHLLLDPQQNVAVLAGQISRLERTLGFSKYKELDISDHPENLRAIAIIAYLHNGKLDYSSRIIRYMQDPELHMLIYEKQQKPLPIKV